jgi:hypothetical protein
MKTQDKVMRVVLESVNSIKDSVEKSLLEAVTSERLKIDQSVVPALVSIVKMAVDDGFQRSYNIVARQISMIIADAIKEVAKDKAPKS